MLRCMPDSRYQKDMARALSIDTRPVDFQPLEWTQGSNSRYAKWSEAEIEDTLYSLVGDTFHYMSRGLVGD